MTEQPPIQPTQVGALRFNTDSGKLEYFDGNQYVNITIDSAEQNTGGTRALFAGGEAPSRVNTITFANIDTTGNAVDFGDASRTLSGHTAFASRTRGLISNGVTGPQPTNHTNAIEFVTIASQGDGQDFGDTVIGVSQRASCSSSTRGLIMAGLYAGQQQNAIDSVTMSQSGNAVDFGDLSVKQNGGHALSSPTRGIIGGGYFASPVSAFVNTIQYVTISTFGNAADFGDLTRIVRYPCTAANAVRGVFAGGSNPSTDSQDTIDFITIATLGNALDFGNLSGVISDFHQGAASPTRAVFPGGLGPAPSYTRYDAISYVQIMTTGNAVDFGDLTAGTQYVAGMSNGHGGLG